MTEEQTKLNTKNPPAAFADYLGETDPKKQIFWSCLGKIIRPKKKLFGNTPRSLSEAYTTVYHTSEEAEAHATIPNPYWIWNKTPAIQTSLQSSMNEARVSGNAGVSIRGFRDGEWVTLKIYPVGEPLL